MQLADATTSRTRLTLHVSPQTGFIHVLEHLPDALRPPLSGSGGRDLQGGGGESVSGTPSDAPLPPPIGGQGLLGGIWPLHERSQRDGVRWVCSSSSCCKHLWTRSGVLQLIHLLDISASCSCRGSEFRGDVPWKGADGFTVEHAPCPRKP